MKVLEGVKVVDFTESFGGPFCTMQLADFGAEVIKIENNEHGDKSRKWEPMQNGHSGYYASVNRNKKGVAVDIASTEGQEFLKKLIEKADIVVENFSVGELEKYNLGYEDVRKINPEIIFASLTAFGQTGPLKDVEADDSLIQAVSGLMEMTGFVGEKPTKAGVSISENFTGLTMSLAIAMTYLNKLNTGKGQKIDLAKHDVVFGILESPILFDTLLSEDGTRQGNADPATLVPYDVYKCKDGYFSAGLASDAGWPNFAETVGMSEMIEDPRYIDNELRCKNYEVFTQTVSEFFIGKTKDELDEIFQNAGIPCAPVLTIPEVMEHPQIKAREMIVALEDKGVGKYSAINNPMKLSKTPAAIEKSAPLLGEDTQSILKELGYTDDQIVKLREKNVI